MNAFRMVRGIACLFFVLLASALVASGAALDREAFSISHYDLNLRLESSQQRMSVRGKITLRNDSATPQRVAVLQISSSLNWRSIRALPEGKAKSAVSSEEGQAVQFLTQPYVSDIDHTGELSEAIVTFPHELSPKQTIELAIGYEGVVVLDAARLIRLGTPESVARHSDWDQIGRGFTAVRGVGYVTWYPVAMEAQNLLDGGAMFAALGKWKTRHSDSKMELRVELLAGAGDKPQLLVNGNNCADSQDADGATVLSGCIFENLGKASPVLIAGNYESQGKGVVRLHVLSGDADPADAFAKTAERAAYLVQDWFGSSSNKVEVFDLADPDAAAYEAGDWLLMPMAKNNPEMERSLAVHQLTHAAFPSPRPWLYEGTAHFAQAVAEEKDGRAAALPYLGAHREAVVQAEKPTSAHTEALANSSEEAFFRSKAALVFWMLRDMVGDEPFKRALHRYQAANDTDSAYFEHLIEAESKRDLAWFFHDWVYADEGLPDFRIDSANARLTNGTSFITAVSVVNAGGAGAEVPVTVHTDAGDFTERLEVRSKSRAVVRIATPTQPLEVIVNDGGVPESGASEHRMKLGGGEVVPETEKP